MIQANLVRAAAVIFGASILNFAVNAFAKEAYLNELVTFVPNNQIMTTTRCNTCHQNGKRLNLFGQDFFRIVRHGQGEKSGLFMQLLDLDSDGDQISNFDELIHGTNPGVAN